MFSMHAFADREQLKRNLNDFWQKVQGKVKSSM